ncbi:MAG: hypothetical protein QG577_2891 [Thermodesulfobacteriota bacterium]|nr:hypothetical protein [Thermodesulfobacteriota bacterium]
MSNSLEWFMLSGAEGRNRTIDTRIFSPLLYRLSYLGIPVPKILFSRAALVNDIFAVSVD